MIKEKQLVVQSNPLVEAQYKLNSTEQKLLRVIISMIQPDTPDLKKRLYRFSVQDFARLLGHADLTSLYKEMLSMAEHLKTAGLRVALPNGDTIRTSWVASYKYPKNKGWIEFEVSSMLETELLRLKDQFTQYYLANISKLKGEYTVRVYELVLQYASTHLRNREISLKDLRAMLGLQNKYKHSSDIFFYVIRIAHKEINAKTDISFSFRPIKESRKFVAIEFYDIEKKSTIPPSILSLIPEEYKKNPEVIRNIQKYLEVRGPEYVTEKINYVVSRKPQNFADYLYSTMENNHGEGFASDTEKVNKVEKFVSGAVFEFGGRRCTFDGNGLKISDTKILNPEEMAQAIQIGLLTPISSESLEKERMEAQLAEYEKYRQETIDAYLAYLSIPERQAAEESFVQNLDAFSRDVFKEKGWDSPMTTSLWRVFLTGRMKHLKNFEEWRSLELRDI